MSCRAFRAPALAVLTLVAAACTAEPHPAASRLCTPGAYVACNCFGGEEKGTKLCADDGQKFGVCEPCPEPQDTVQSPIDAFTPDTGPGKPDVAAASDDQCPGAAATVDGSGDLDLNGDTTLAKGDFTGLGACAAGSSAKDSVHELTVGEKGRLKLTVSGSGGFDAVLYVRKGDCGKGEQIACSDKSGADAAESADLFVDPGDKLYVIVDGKGGSSGAYTLNAHLEAGTFCGDGAIDPEEACDDGNPIAGDGCSPTCQPDGDPPSASACPGREVHLWSNPVEVKGSTTNYANTYKATCGGGASKDAVVAVVAHKNGTLHAVITASEFDTVIYARSDTCTTGIETACASLVKGLGGEKMTFAVKKDRTYYVFIDGFNYTKGTYTLSLAVK